MGDIPNNQDKRLLERLNALKPSTVQLERQKNLALSSSATSAASLFPAYNDNNDPAADFAGSGKLDDGSASSANALLGEDDVLAPESLLDGDAIEDLLASLDSTRRPGLDAQLSTHTGQEQERKRDDTKDLLSGAYEFIQQSSSTGAGADIDTNQTNPRKEDIPGFMRDEDEDDDEEEEESSDEKDDAEAAKYVENLLKELSENPLSELPTEAEETTSGPINKDDDNLSTRLAALSLPSVPSDQPGTPTQTAKRENTSPECCCICYDTAAVKCTDCEGNQLFCVRCWWEMHMADGSDMAEARHKAVKYNPS